ncbi:MAG: DUF1501 domain-containing protein, partial [Pirellula sp.]
MMTNPFQQLETNDRRQFLALAAKASLGVSLFPSMDRALVAADRKGKNQAKRLIYLFMSGGMTHIDTFDVKPGHANQGITKAINTSVPGCQIGEHLPNLAQQFG